MSSGSGSKSGGRRLHGNTLLSQSKHPLFTVITAVFNGADRLESTIQSVLSQRYADVEYIVIDGGSTDATLDILRQYEKSIDHWVSEPDSGVYDAFNKGCRLRTGLWTIFLGAGDLLYDADVFAAMADVLQGIGSEPEIVYGKVSLTTADKVPVETLNAPWNQMQGRWKSGRPMLPHHQGVFHRDRILMTATPFDVSYRIAADSKLLYSSIQRTEPVFSDIVVTSASVGGVSTNVRLSLAAAREVMRVNREFGFTNLPHESWFYSKAVLKGAINQLAGDRLSMLCVDGYRRITGRERLQER